MRDSLRDLLDDFGRLPPADGPHRATLSDVEAAFVNEAPFEERRRLIFQALSLYSTLVWASVPQARLWIDGGFTTRKEWAAPKDTDVLVIVPIEVFLECKTDAWWPLHTLQHVSAVEPSMNSKRVHAMGGLVDAFVEADHAPNLLPWHELWSSVKGQDGLIIDGLRKGYVEVTRN